MKLPSIGITLRTALLSWSVTLATLLIFVAVIVPWQKRTFLANLESKAHGVAVSLHGVAAGAAVNEDYSNVVDYCREMLQGDGSLSYLVITRNDGYSLIQDRSGWRAESGLGETWRPARRVPVGGIRFEPLFQRRTFHYSMPFDYSAIEWGWIHVGLKLDAYEQSVRSLYRLAAILGAVCIALSLVASMAYARRLVRPVLNLRATVQRVAGGDLSARAETDRNDELGSLAASVNAMTEALLHRDEILGSVQFAAQQFLGTPRWQSVIDGVLAAIGTAAGASRAYVIEHESPPAAGCTSRRVHEWAAATFERGEGDVAVMLEAGSARWAEILRHGELFAARASELPEAERACLESRRIRSLLIIPIVVESAWWGCLGFEDCEREREWSDAERDSLRAAADMLGSAVARERAQDELLEAKANLERKVHERTEALQRQIVERKAAESALARSLALINATLESTLDGIMVLDRDGRVKHFNRRFSEMWQISPDFLTSGRNRQVFAQAAARLKDPKGFIKKALELHVDPSAESYDIIEFADGRIFERYTRPQQFDGISAGRVWCYRDITARKAAEAEIAYERDLLQTLMDSLPDYLYFKDLESRFLRVSRSMLEDCFTRLRERHVAFQQVGRSTAFPPHLENLDTMRRWLTGRQDMDVFGPSQARTLFDEEQAIIRTGQPVEGKIECLTEPSGRQRWFLVTKMPWRDRAGRIIGTYGVSKDITAIKEAEEKLNAVHRQLMDASRQAGMAEVATGVLHNVGNVLNSVNVSTTHVRDMLAGSEISTLTRVAALLQEHEADLPRYLAEDPKGRVLPDFIIKLSHHLEAEHRALRAEHDQLARNVEHIKEVVAMQQSYARVSGVVEKLRIADIVADALRINTAGLARHGIEVIRNYGDVPPVLIDRHKVLQILVNFIHNAKYALDCADRTDRRITITVARTTKHTVRIAVADNGIGISRENLVKVFSRGFTTRRDGHGFGLHSGAIAAKEMGGTLRAESEGEGRGATFILELPFNDGSPSS